MFYSLCVVFFFLPLGTSLTIISSVVALSVWLFSGKALKDRKRWLGPTWAFPVFVFIALHWLGLLYTNDVSLGLETAKKTYYWLMAFAVASVSLEGRSAETFLKSFIAGLTVMCVISLLKLVGILPMTRTLISIFSHHITNSLLLVAGILILSFKFRGAGDAKHKSAILLGMALFFFTLTIGVSRAGYLAFILISPFIVYNLTGRKHIIKVAVLALLLVGAVLMSPTVQMRISQAVIDIKLYKEGYVDSALGLRFVMWKGAVKIIEENPALGVGTGGYMKALRKYNDAIPMDIDDPHNSYLYMTTSFGVVGLACLLWLLYVPLRRGWTNRRNIAGFSIFSFTAVIVIGSLTSTLILSPASGVALAGFMGLQEHLERLPMRESE